MAKIGQELPDELVKEIDDLASNQKRSRNKQIEFLLELALSTLRNQKGITA